MKNLPRILTAEGAVSRNGSCMATYNAEGAGVVTSRRTRISLGYTFLSQDKGCRMTGLGCLEKRHVSLDSMKLPRRNMGRRWHGGRLARANAES